jgi:hypothetical protein
MTDTAFPHLYGLIGGWFHQDFDIEGSTVAEVMQAFCRATPMDQRAQLNAEITRFLSEHPDDLDASFEATFKPDVIPSVLAGSTRAFLEQIRASLGLS